MLVTFCDICSCPIKGDHYCLVTMKYRTGPQAADEYSNGHIPVQRDEEKEICETCYLLIQRIFEYRNLKMLSLAEDCKTLYERPTKEPKKEKRHKDTKD